MPSFETSTSSLPMITNTRLEHSTMPLVALFEIHSGKRSSVPIWQRRKMRDCSKQYKKSGQGHQQGCRIRRLTATWSTQVSFLYSKVLHCLTTARLHIC